MQVVFRAERLKQARLKKNLTQEALAERCNSSDRYIRDLENGRKTNLSAQMLCLLVSNLEISMEELVDIQQGENV